MWAAAGWAPRVLTEADLAAERLPSTEVLPLSELRPLDELPRLKEALHALPFMGHPGGSAGGEEEEELSAVVVDAKAHRARVSAPRPNERMRSSHAQGSYT